MAADIQGVLDSCRRDGLTGEVTAELCMKAYFLVC